jgi:hypothetical protein
MARWHILEVRVDKARNDLSAAVPKFCLALEEHRRTPDGRVRTSQELLATFFPHDEKVCTDRIFRFLPQEVRGPITAAWGIRGIKAAMRDNDEKTTMVVHDALVAGDLDHTAFEDGLAPETLVRWVPLADLWSFWRGGKLTKGAIHKALSTAYELYLFDARWFLDTINAKGGSIRGTDVLADGLSKDELTQWIHRIHETGDGTPKGMVASLGWDKIVAKTANDVLVSVLDAMVTKVGLVVPGKDSGPKLPDDLLAKLDDKIGAPILKDAESSPVLTGGAPTEDTGWSLAPQQQQQQEGGGPSAQAAPPLSEESIAVVVDDEVIIGDRNPPTSPQIRSAPLAPSFEDDQTEIKSFPQRRPEPNKPPPPMRPGRR